MMSLDLAALKPIGKERLIDLVERAGIDVSEWRDSPTSAANPSFCYRWAFTDEKGICVFNLWHRNIKAGAIHSGNMLRVAEENTGPRKTRAEEFDRILSLAAQPGWVSRVILLDGEPGENYFKTAKRRKLDPNKWSVVYRASGDYTISRTSQPA